MGEKQVLKNNNFDGFSLGAKCKPRTKLDDIRRVNAYTDIINNIGWSMFEWSGIPNEAAKTLSSDMIERAVNCGAAAIFKVPEKSGSASAGMWVAAPLEWVGVRKTDNTADDYIVRLYDASFTKRDINAVVVRNNFEMTSDYDFTEWYADMLNETDISENQLIKWSRMTPIAKATSNAAIAQIEAVLRRVYNGEPWAVLADFTKIIGNGSPTSRDDTVLRLTDETAIEKMHFLSEYHYELIRRLCNLYNIPFHTTAKSAQNLESELHNTDIFSRMLPEKKLFWRRQSLPDFAKVFGDEWSNVSVDMGEMFKKENEVIENIIESTAPEPVADTTETNDEPAEPNESGESNE